MINFNALPTDKPLNTPEAGTYYATITDAVMKQPQDISKPKYLNLTLDLKNKSGKSCGKVYDILAESDKPTVQYKLSRFLIALGLDKVFANKTFELVDLIRVVKNKQLIVDVTVQPAKDNYPAKATVDAFGGSVYYPMSEAAEIFGIATPNASDVAVVDDDLSINANDAVDVHNTDDEF